MDFKISEKMQATLELVDEFVDKELLPLEQDYLTLDFKDLLPTLAKKREMVKKWSYGDQTFQRNSEGWDFPWLITVFF